MPSKITIEFIDDPEAALMAMDAPNMYSALWDIDQFLREIQKYAILTEDQEEIVGQIRDRFHEILNDKAIKL